MWRTQAHPFTPWPNTVAYFPLRGDVSDVTGNYHLTNVDNLVTFGIADGVTCANFSSNTNKLITVEDMPFTGSDPFTISMWVKDGWNRGWYWAFGQPPAEVDPITWEAIVGWNRAVWLYQNSYNLYKWCRWNDGILTQNPIDVWTNYIFTFNWTTDHTWLHVFTIDTSFSWEATNYDIQSWPLVLWSDLVDWAVLYDWSMNEVIVENRAWTYQEALDYFNSTCTEYGYLPFN